MAGDDKQKLRRLNEKRIKTTFIGSISLFERQFSFLWGGVIDELGEMSIPTDMTETEKKFYNMYLQFRADTLRLGNNQIRLSGNDINSFDVQWNGLEIVFRPRDL